MTLKDAYELLSDPLLLLPQQASGEFQIYVQQLLDSFGKKMQAAASRFGLPSRDRLNKIDALSQCLRGCLALSLAGEADAALQQLSSGLTMVEGELFLVSERNTSVMSGQTLYRLIRHYPKFDPQRRDSVFHIRFEDRGLASAVRYSVKGHPSLYLGNSIYLCWLECDRPANLKTWYASRFDLDFRRLKVLDLSASTALLKSVLDLAAMPPVPGLNIEPGRVTNSPTGEDWEDYLSSSLVIWPLLATCSLSAVHSNSAVSPEYLVPQLAMKWVQQNHQIGAIRFFSTREQAIRSTQDISINYALPAKATEKTCGYDDFLAGIALCSYPICIGDFQNRKWKPPDSDQAYQVAERNWRRLTVPPEDGGTQYFGTWYCNLEYALDGYETGRIESTPADGAELAQA